MTLHPRPFLFLLFSLYPIISWVTMPYEVASLITAVFTYSYVHTCFDGGWNYLYDKYIKYRNQVMRAPYLKNCKRGDRKGSLLCIGEGWWREVEGL